MEHFLRGYQYKRPTNTPWCPNLVYFKWFLYVRNNKKKLDPVRDDLQYILTPQTI